MKQIKLKLFDYPDKSSVYSKRKQYDVFLKSGYRVHFKSLSALHNFVRKINKDLNLILHELNHIYTNQYGIYRHMWFYFYDETSKANHLGLESKLTRYFHEVEEFLHKVVTRTSGPNGHEFTFKFLEHAAASLYLATDILDRMCEVRSDHATRYRIQSDRKRIEEIRQQLQHPC